MMHPALKKSPLFTKKNTSAFSTFYKKNPFPLFFTKNTPYFPVFFTKKTPSHFISCLRACYPVFCIASKLFVMASVKNIFYCGEIYTYCSITYQGMTA